MPATSLEAAAVVVSNLATAMRANALYREALDGRRSAEEASILKGRFLSTVSHELRTPLSVIVGLSDMILREAGETGELSKIILSDLQRMASSAEHLGRLISDVLDLASGEAGQLRLSLEPVDLADVLAPAAVAGRQMAAAKGLGFRCTLPASGPWVLGDRTRLRQVTLNLINNAVKYTDAGSVCLEVSGSHGCATVSVVDTGIGVSASDRERIFHEFQRVPRTTGPSPGGLGLGLTIARQLVELHDGTLDVRSPGRGGRGSTFSFTLPTLAPFASPGAAPGRPPPETDATVSEVVRFVAGSLVLLVDDDPDVLDLHTRIVIEAGGDVLSAADARSAMEIMEARTPDLVLLDLGLPGASGFDVLEAMRSRASTREIPVLVITGQPLTNDVLDRLNGSVVSILSKGLFTSRETLARIGSAMSGRRTLGSPTQRIVRQAMAWIDQHHADAIDRDQIARQVAISPDYLTECFQQELGVTPMTYLSRCRIRHARELLEVTDQPVTSVAMAVGFADVSHFTRTFHRDVGVSPRAYRRGRLDTRRAG